MAVDWNLFLVPNADPPTPEGIQQFEQAMGLELPFDYKEFLLRFNGGEVKMEHEIYVPAIDSDVIVTYLWPLTAAHPFLGIAEARRMQVDEKWCLRQSIAIGSDGGTGDYYLVLSGEKTGAVFFVWLDERPGLSDQEWEDWEVKIPADMVEIAPDFDSFGQLILESARRTRS